MRGALCAEIVAFNRTGEAFTFGCTCYINQLTCFKQRYGDYIARFQFSRFFFRDNKLVQTATRFNTCFRKVSGLRFVYMVCFFLTKGNLNGCIAIRFFGFYLGNAVSSHFQHGYRNRCTLFRKHACHAYFASNQT